MSIGVLDVMSTWKADAPVLGYMHGHRNITPWAPAVRTEGCTSIFLYFGVGIGVTPLIGTTKCVAQQAADTPSPVQVPFSTSWLLFRAGDPLSLAH